jgi:hypothetical protein
MDEDNGFHVANNKLQQHENQISQHGNKFLL